MCSRGWSTISCEDLYYCCRYVQSRLIYHFIWRFILWQQPSIVNVDPPFYMWRINVYPRNPHPPFLRPFFVIDWGSDPRIEAWLVLYYTRVRTMIHYEYIFALIDNTGLHFLIFFQIPRRISQHSGSLFPVVYEYLNHFFPVRPDLPKCYVKSLKITLNSCF